MNESELRAALRSPAPEQRFAAAYVAGERRLNWRKELIERLTDESDAVRQAARRSLVILGFLALNPEEAVKIGSAMPRQRATPLAQLKKPVDFGPLPGASRRIQAQSAQNWADWWARVDTPQPDKPSIVVKTDPRLPDTESGRLARTLLQAATPRRKALLEQYRETRGVQYTEALAFAIPCLEADARLEARAALRERMGRMKEQQLGQYLDDEDAEIRRAAVLGVAMRDSKAHTPRIIELLLDRDPLVRRASHIALKELSGKDLGPPLNPTEKELNEAVSQWRAWWQIETGRP